MEFIVFPAPRFKLAVFFGSLISKIYRYGLIVIFALSEAHISFVPPNRYVFKGAEVYDNFESDTDDDQ